MSGDPIRIFVGCAREHRLAFRVLRHSITRRTSRPVEVYPLNNADASRPQDRWEDDPLADKYPPIWIPIPEARENRGRTTFSFQRFLIPQLCGDRGFGIYLDSDQLVLADIAEFWDQDILGHAVLKPPGWQSAVMKIDCAIGWRIQKLVRQMDSRKRDYRGLLNLKQVGALNNGLSPSWNVQDRDNPTDEQVAAAKLLHFTDMRTQPWLRREHPWGELWGNELLDAVAVGVISPDEIMAAIDAGDVRPSLAHLIGRLPPYPDHQFIYPDDRAKGEGNHI